MSKDAAIAVGDRVELGGMVGVVKELVRSTTGDRAWYAIVDWTELKPGACFQRAGHHKIQGPARLSDWSTASRADQLKVVG